MTGGHAGIDTSQTRKVNSRGGASGWWAVAAKTRDTGDALRAGW